MKTERKYMEQEEFKETKEEKIETPSIDETEEKAQDLEKVQDDMVPKSELRRVLNDMHKFKSRYKELEDQLKTREMSELKKREEWQKLADHYEKESAEYKQRFEGLQNALIKDKKISEVKTHAMKAGLRQEALADLDMLDLDDIEIETTSSGRYNVLGADKFVNRLKVNRPHWFGRSVGSINSKDPEVVKAQGVSYEQITKAAEKARSTGNYAEYEKLLKQYKQQQN